MAVEIIRQFFIVRVNGEIPTASSMRSSLVTVVCRSIDLLAKAAASLTDSKAGETPELRL